MGRYRSEQMRKHWEKFAEDDPMYYIATWNKDWTLDDFFASGLEMAERIAQWAGRRSGGRMLEIGCGLGRTAVHFSRWFERVDGVDISGKMIEMARSLNPPDHVHFSAISGTDLRHFENETFDLVYSYIVFQHIPEEAVIESYLREISRVLKPAGQAALQFDTRPEGALIKLYKSLPDPLLPRPHRRFIRRYRRQPERLQRLMEGAGLRVEDEQGHGTAEHFFLLRK